MRPKRRWLVVLLVLLGGLVVARVSIGRSTGAAVARLRARGVPMDLDELERWRLAVPASNNLSLAVQEAGERAARLDLKKTGWPFLLEGEFPAHPANHETLERWRSVLNQADPVFRALADGRSRTECRYPPTPDTNSRPRNPDLLFLYEVSRLIELGVVVETDSDHPAQAANHIREFLQIARSLEHEPTDNGQYCRTVALRQAVAATAYFTRTQATDADWISLQAAFSAAEGINPEARCLFGSAAFSQFIYDATELQWAGSLGRATNGAAGIWTRVQGLAYVASGLKSADRRRSLEIWEALIEAAEHPYPEALRRSTEISDRARAETIRASKSLLPRRWVAGLTFAGPFSPFADCRAAVRSAIVGCAIERYRLRHAGQIPAMLDELVPELLPAVPLDPYDGRPLRYRHTNDTYVVYSVGPDLQDDGGSPRPRPRGSGGRHDVGFPILP